MNVKSALRIGFLLAALLQVSTAINVEFKEVWGTINLHAGDSQDLVCQASEVAEPGRFSWSIGDESLGESSALDYNEEGTYEQQFTYTPKLEHDGKKLTCRYTEGGDSLTEAEDQLTVSVTYSNFPVGTVDSGEYDEGSDVELEVAFEMHPEPDPEAFVWVIEGGEEQEIRIKPGSSSGHYHATNIEATGVPRQYIVSLEVNEAGREELSKSHTLEVNQDRGMLSIPVTFQLIEKQVEPLPEPSNEPKEVPPSEEATTEVSGVSAGTMSVGLIVIVAFIVLILLICIGYCTYQKCCRGNTNGPSGSQSKYSDGRAYTKANTDDTQKV